MDHYTDWADIPSSNDLLKSQDLEQYLENYDEIDDLFNETLLGIQDLDVPTGFNKKPGHTASSSYSFHQAKHSRKISGTAIFGFDNHTRELSLEKSISPVQLVKMNEKQPIAVPQSSPLKHETKKGEFASENPKSYKFPPSPSPSHRNNAPPQMQPINSYSAKYLQELSNMDQEAKPERYVDDIEPLLKEEMKYVPIPVQDPTPHQFSNANTYLPPPSPPHLSQQAPNLAHSPLHQSHSPESSPTHFDREKSPVHLNSSPVNSNYFYNPTFFSDDNYFYDQQYQSPTSQTVSSSPIKGNYYSSPLRQVPLNDDTVDVNETIAQLTPLRNNQPPMTPSRNKVVLEWSPIVSPNSKNNRDVKDAIKQSSPKRRIKKTSLLPPGELDKFFSGPDENKVFTCTFKGCGKNFTRRYNVRSHIQTHLSDRPFACMYCPKKFVRQHDLNRHVKGHLEARNCRCPCGKEFTRIDAMRKHRLRNICSGGVPLDQADSLRSPEKSPLKTHSPLRKEIEQSENDITNDILQGLTDIPAI